MTARRLRKRLSIVWAASALLVAVGCADADSSGDGGAGPSVEIGADQQAYIDALADMEPVTLTMQSTAPKGAATGRRFEAYAEAVDEWSGGKITFDIKYSNAVAPPDEVDNALADGRLDVGSVIVALEPAEFPVNNVLWDLSFIGSQLPVQGLLEWHGAMIQAAVESDAIQQEFEERGMHALLPTFGSGSYFVECRDAGATLSELDGRTIASQSQVQSAQAEALGMSPSTIPYSEMFESLERGVVDCAMSTLTVSTLVGFIAAAPELAYSPDVGLASPGGSIAISLDRWDSLPLAAQQLLHDRMDVVLEANFKGTWDNVKAGVAAVDEAGGSITELDSGAVDALRDANDATLDGASETDPELVESLADAEEDWASTIADLRIDGADVDYDAFPAWYADGAPDLTAYFEELADVMSARRPS